MAKARVFSDGGHVTVGRRTSSYTYGQFEVVLPDGEQQEQRDDRIVDAYIYRPDDAGSGRAELTFVRADARIDMNAQRSDLETTLDSASRRTEGEAYYTREISGLGLAGTKPGVDYVEGDIIEVVVWGQIMELPVTAMRYRSSPDDPTVDAIQVGGQVLRDPVAMRKRNDALDAQIAAEKRQRLRQVGEVQKVADSAQETASTIDEDLDRSVEVVAEELGLPSPAKAHRMEVITSETLAQAVEANTAVIGLAFPQESIVPTGMTGLPYWAIGSQSSSARPEVYEPPTDLSEYSFRPAGESSSSARAFFTLSSRVDYKVSVWVRGDVGQRAYLSLVDEDGQLCLQQWQPWYPIPGSWVEAQRLEIAVVEPEGDPEEVVEPDEWTRHEWAVRLTPGTRRARLVVDDGGAAGTPWLNRLSVSVLNRPQEEVDRAQSEQIAENRRITGELGAITKSLGHIQNLLAESLYAYLSYTVTPVEAGTSWTELWSVTPAVPVTYTVYMRIGWQDATLVDEYGLSFHINGVRRGVWQERGLGPLFGGDYRVQARRWTGVRVEAGDTISFRVRSSASFGINRRIEDGLITLTQET